MIKTYGKLSLSILLFLVFTPFAAAQDLDDVVIFGRVTDIAGAAVPGVSVSAVLVSTDAGRTASTDEYGEYRLIELSPGTYNIGFHAEGFAGVLISNVESFSGQSIRRDVRIGPAAVYAEQTVNTSEEETSQIDTGRTVVGGTLSGREILELPNSSNDVLDLIFALGGIAEEPFAIRDLADDDRIGGGSERDRPREVAGAGSYSLSGGAAYSTNITIDGLDNNDDRAAEERFQPPADAVAEVQIVTSQFSAEYGRASGGRINIRTRSGTRKFRGRLFAFFEDEILNANTYNNNRRGLGRLPFTEYNPGGTVQGPLPARLFGNGGFFFSSFSSQNREASSLIDTVLPVDINPLYPLPAPTHLSESRVDDIPNPTTDTFPAVDIAPYRAVISAPSRRIRFTQRIDRNFGERHGLTLNYQFGRSRNFRQYRETSRFLEETIQGRTRRNDAFYVTYNVVIGPKLVNQFRFQFSRYSPDFKSKGAADPVVLLFVSDDSRSGSGEQVRGTVVIGNSTANFATLRRERRIQTQENLTRVLGRHTLRLGADVHLIESSNTDLSDATGTFNFSRVHDFLTSQPSRYRRNFGATSRQTNTYYGLFMQDEWRPRNGLTFSIGLRYERESVVKDGDNFGPRIAVAWAPGNSRKTVFRAGAGIFYNRTLLRTLDDYTIGAKTVRFDSETLAGPSDERRCLNQRVPGTNALTDKCRFLGLLASKFPVPPTLAELLGMMGSLGISNGGFVDNTNFSRLVQPGIKLPESYQFNAGFEHDLGHGLSFEVNFTFNRAVRLWRETNINAYRTPEGFNTLTDYLVSLGAIHVNGVMTKFEVGNPSDAGGVRTDAGVRIVNLATLNSSEARSAPIGIAFDALSSTLQRPYDNDLGQVEMVSAMGRSVYEGLSVELRRRFGSIPFGFRGALRFVYEVSSTRDDGFVDTSSAQIAGDFQSEFGASGIDRRHKIRLSGTLEAPGWLGRIRMSPILRVESGRPFNISIGGSDRNLDDVGNDRPNFSGDAGSIVSRKPGDPFPNELAGAFSLAPIGTPGNLPRNAGRGPGLFIFNAVFSRDFRFTDRVRFRPEITFDNILNATVFSFGSDFINLADSGTAEFARGFLVPGRTLAQRKVQIGFRLDL